MENTGRIALVVAWTVGQLAAIGAWWLLAYWCAFATVLAVLAYALWRRGATVALRPRLAQLKQRLRGPALE